MNEVVKIHKPNEQENKMWKNTNIVEKKKKRDK